VALIVTDMMGAMPTTRRQMNHGATKLTEGLNFCVDEGYYYNLKCYLYRT
jgi:hypothetical protein